jgi:hypothetical protein
VQALGRPQLANGRDYVRVKVTRKYLYRAVDKAGATVDFPADRQTGSQSRVAILAQGDQVEWDT